MVVGRGRPEGLWPEGVRGPRPKPRKRGVEGGAKGGASKNSRFFSHFAPFFSLPGALLVELWSRVAAMNHPLCEPRREGSCGRGGGGSCGRGGPSLFRLEIGNERITRK